MNEKPEFIPTRHSLLSRLRNWDDQDSWKEFFDVYWKLIYSTARKSGLTDAEAQDVVQETIISVCKNIPGFRYDPQIGSFKTWLLNLTHWRIVDQLRKRIPTVQAGHRAADDTQRTDIIERIPDPAGSGLTSYWNEEWEKNIVEVAIERVKRQIDPKHYQIFDLLVMHEWPARKVAARLKVNIALVYLTKHRVSKLIKKEMKTLEKYN
ncbi:MAG: sigma-70 family RNA polymerase sigma factor [Chloroflexi bacterium]|nr:sigma-70 family RNA polymerase sigma factor [Chloroflexota bacterium]